MTTWTVPKEAEEWGYLLNSQSDQTGNPHHRLYVTIRDKPTEAHYDPEQVDLCLFVPDRGVMRTKLGRHAHFAHERRVCPGPIHLVDRFGKQLVFFTYGGRLCNQEEADKTIYRFESPAPILEMEVDRETLQNLLAMESEGQLARGHVRWGRDDAGFNERLIQIDPRQLFQAILGAIVYTQEENQSLFAESPAFAATLHQWAKEWCVTAQEDGLAQLLAPGDPVNPVQTD